MSDRLVPAKLDDVVLAGEVLARYQEVEGRHQRLRGTPLLVPGHLATAFMLFRRVVSRFSRRDHRHTSSERQAVREVAQWIVDVNAELCGVPPRKIEWAD